MAQKIIVIGGGIIGSASAYHLQKSGARVTVVDAGLASATDSSFGWINASFFENTDHFYLRASAIEAYRALSQELDLPINWCGCLCWEETGKAFDAQLNTLKSLGYDVLEIDRQEFTQREPHIASPPERCLYFRQEAAVESRQLAKVLLNAAVSLGARVIDGVAAQDFIETGNQIRGVRTTAGDMLADQVLAATGTATQDLLATIDVSLPMLTRPGLMLQTNQVAAIFNHVLVSQLGELRQLPDGSLLMPAAVNHQADTSDSLNGSAAEVADDALVRLQALIPETPLHWTRAMIANRPVPKDGLPVAGRVREGLYVATMHSGVTLAALMGRIIATEMSQGMTQETDQLLGAYRVERF